MKAVISKALRAVATLALIGVLSACGTLQNHFSPGLLTAESLSNPQNGVVLLSTGADDKCVSFSTFLYLIPEGQGYGSHAVALVPVDAYVIKSDFDDHYGFIHAISVPAGHYYFAPWLANPYFVAVHVPRFDIDVHAGETVYAGEYRQPGRCSTGRGNVSDQWTRDRALIAERNPNIDLDHATTRLMVFGGDAVTGEPAAGAASVDKPIDKPTEPPPSDSGAEAATPTATAPLPQQ